jgi:hypothetical protein
MQLCVDGYFIITSDTDQRLLQAACDEACYIITLVCQDVVKENIESDRALFRGK